MSTYASCYYVSLNALDEMHLSRVFYVFLNTSNKLRDNVVISIVNNLYLISIYIYIHVSYTSNRFSGQMAFVFCGHFAVDDRASTAKRSCSSIYDHDDKSIGHRCFERGRNFIKVTNYSIYSLKILQFAPESSVPRIAETKLITRANILQRITYE